MKKRRIIFRHMKKKHYFCTVKLNSSVGDCESIDIVNQIVLIFNEFYLPVSGTNYNLCTIKTN